MPEVPAPALSPFRLGRRRIGPDLMQRCVRPEQLFQLLLLRRANPKLAAMLGNVMLPGPGNANLAVAHALHVRFLLEEDNKQAAVLFVSKV